MLHNATVAPDRARSASQSAPTKGPTTYSNAKRPDSTPHGISVADHPTERKNLGGRPVEAKTIGQNALIDTRCVIDDVEADVQGILEDAEVRLGQGESPDAVRNDVRCRINDARNRLRDGASAIYLTMRAAA